jgi:CRISPR-associated protein Cas1
VSGGPRGNTLYVQADGALIRVRQGVLHVVVDHKVKTHLPLHHINSIAVLGSASVTSQAIQMCVDAGVSFTFLSRTGKLIARVDAPTSGNVLLRREQFRAADDPARCLGVARSLVAGKLGNARRSLMRAAREVDDEVASEELATAAEDVRERLLLVRQAMTMDELRGIEGLASRAYFRAFRHLARGNDCFRMQARTRRPPRDPLNALMSFAYALLLNDCVAALTTVGLDPSVGFMHTDRPGRPGLALDLMEEFRPLIADRAVLSLVNRRQVGPEHFRFEEGGAVLLNDEGRRALISGYHARKQEEVVHPLLGVRAPLAEYPFIQARLLARHVRGELPVYPPCVLR